MTTIADLIPRIENRLFLASGLDVQIHAEDSLLEILRSGYTVLFDDYWSQDNLLFKTYTLDGVTGNVNENVSTDIARYSDIQAVYYDEDDDPLPALTGDVNPGKVRSRCVAPSGTANKLFKIMPVDTTGNVHVWYRTRLPDSVWSSGNVNFDIMMDDELLILYVISEYLTADGSNPRAAQLALSKFEQRKKDIQKLQWNTGIAKRSVNYDAPANRWE